MKIRIYETNNLELGTVAKMLLMPDKQANYNPNSHWIMETNEGRTQNNNLNEEGLQKRYKELSVKLTGGDAVVMRLCLN